MRLVKNLKKLYSSEKGLPETLSVFAFFYLQNNQWKIRIRHQFWVPTFFNRSVHDVWGANKVHHPQKLRCRWICHLTSKAPSHTHKWIEKTPNKNQNNPLRWRAQSPNTDTIIHPFTSTANNKYLGKYHYLIKTCKKKISTNNCYLTNNMLGHR